MPNVSCPSCSTRQEITEGSKGYTCTSCGRVWEFVVCDSCGSRFHAKPGTTEWTCPTCGTAHPSTTSPQPVPISGDDLEAVPPEAPVGPQQPGAGSDPGTAFPMPRADKVGLVSRIPAWAWAAVAAVLVVAITVILVTRNGNETPTTGGSAMETLCGHVRGLPQTIRVDALGRAQEDLKADVRALKAEGDQATAKQVQKLIAAVAHVRDDLERQKDTTDSVAAMGKALSAIDCS